MAVTQAYKEVIWKERLLKDFIYKQEKIIVFYDSQSALHIIRNQAFHSRTRYIRVHFHYFRDVEEDIIVHLQKIHTKENLANVLTKSINGDMF